MGFLFSPKIHLSVKKMFAPLHAVLFERKFVKNAFLIVTVTKEVNFHNFFVEKMNLLFLVKVCIFEGLSSEQNFLYFPLKNIPYLKSYSRYRISSFFRCFAVSNIAQDLRKRI